MFLNFCSALVCHIWLSWWLHIMQQPWPLAYRISGIFRAGKFWRKCRLEGVLNFHWVLFSLLKGLSMKTYSRVYFLLCLFLAITGRSRTQRKLNPREKFPIYGSSRSNKFPAACVCCPPLSRKRGDIKSHSSVCPVVCPSVCHKKFNLGHNFFTITDRVLILGMCVPCDKTFPEVPCRDLDGDLWPTSRSNLLPSGGPQFSEFLPFIFYRYKIVAVVMIGQKTEQGVQIGSRYLWDADRDNFAAASFHNRHIFCVGSVYAMYYEWGKSKSITLLFYI